MLPQRSSANAPLRGPRLVGYAAADFGKECFWRVFETFSLFYLTSHLGFAPAFAGALILFGLLSDIVWDLAVGAVIDWRSARGRGYGAYFLLAPVLCAGSLLAFFGLHASPWRGVGITLAALFVFRGLYAFVDIPVNALTARLSLDDRTRSLAWGWKKGWAAVAGLAVAGLAAWIPTRQASGLALFVLALAPAAIAAYALSWRSIAAVQRSGDPVGERPAPTAGLRRRALGHPAIWLLTAIMFANAAFTPIFAKALPFLQPANNQAWLGQVLGALSVGNLLAIPLATALALKLGRRNTLRLLFMILIVAAVALALARLDGWTGTLAIGALGFGAAGAAMILWSMTPDLLDHVASHDRDAVQGQILSLCSIAVKAGVGLSALTLGGVLQVSASGSQLAAVPLQTTIAAVSMLGGVFGVALLGFYPLSGRPASRDRPPAPAAGEA